VEGDAERAALLAGAAEGLRQRVGLRAWPLQRQGEAEMVARIREVLAADRFEQAFVTGAGLNRREAVAAVRARRAPHPSEPWRSRKGGHRESVPACCHNRTSAQ
jgi:hypothetical protein